MDISPAILESTPYCILVLDEDLRLVFGNTNFHRFIEENFGISMEPGFSLLDAVPEEKRPRYSLRLKEVLSGQCARLEESLNINGFTRYFDVTYQPLEGGTIWDKVVITFDDITSRKRREMRLLDEEAHLTNRIATRETLLSVISHDLRAPVFQLNGLLFLIRQAAESRDEARLQMQADDLEQRIAHLTHTLDNLLSWSSLQRQGLVPQVTQFQLKPVFEHAIGLLKPSAHQKDVRIYCKGLNATELVSDREMVAFLVRNLINNAIKFSHNSGKVEVTVSQTREGVCFTVKDFGVGMRPDRIDSLKDGENYFSETGTWGEHGTGLGLSLCAEFVKRLKGVMAFDSSPGKGTLVTVTLPQMDLS
ncbi:MAG: ATP-binding protein [Puniceicoccaceae bacterium]